MNQTSDRKALAAGCLFHFFSAIFFFSFGAPLAAAAPQITHFEPSALAPGKTLELTIRGQSLQNPRSLWTTFAERCEFDSARDDIAKKGEKLVCHVTVPRDEQVGVGAL